MRIICLFAVVLFLFGCATPYQKFEGVGRGGYNEAKIDERSYKVSLVCNQYTSDEKCEAMLRFRAAELTLENGFDYFIFRNGKPQRKSPLSFRPTYEEIVTFGSGDLPEKNDWAFEARKVIENLRFIVQR